MPRDRLAEIKAKVELGQWFGYSSLAASGRDIRWLINELEKARKSVAFLQQALKDCNETRQDRRPF